MLYTTCHDWSVDSNLLPKELAEGNDVSSSIKVGVQSQPTIIALIPDSFAVGFSNLAAVRAGLTCVLGADVFNSLSESLSFVLQELLELFEAPGTQELVEPPTLVFASSDTQLLDDKELCIPQSYLLADAVVDISHKPLFSSAKLPEMPLCGTSAFALQLRFEPLVSAFDSTNLSAVKKLSVTCDDGVDNPSVNAKSLSDCDFWDIPILGYHVEDNLTILDAECCSGNLPIKVRCEVGRDFERQFDSAKGCGDADNALLQERLKGVVIEPDSRQFLFDWQPPELLTLQHITSLVAGSCYKAAIQIGPAFSDGPVGGSVESELVVSPEFEAFSQDEITSLIVGFDSLCDSLVVRQDQFDSSLHYPLINILKDKNH